MKKDLFSGLFFSGLGLILWLTMPYSIPHIDQFSQMGPRFFPSFFSIVLIFLGLVLAVQSFPKRGSRKNGAATEGFPLKAEIPILISFLIMIGACVLFSYFRYLISMPISVTAMLLFYKVKKWYIYLTMYTFVALFYLIFAKMMYVQL